MPLSFRNMLTTIGIRVDPPTNSSRVTSFHSQSRRRQQLPGRVRRALEQIGGHFLELLARDGDFDHLAGPLDANDRPAAGVRACLASIGGGEDPIHRQRVLPWIDACAAA